MGLAENIKAKCKAAIEDGISTAMSDDVLPFVQGLFMDNAMADIYSKYAPAIYQRRMSFLDPGTYVPSSIGATGLSIDVESAPNMAYGGEAVDLPDLIEYGEGGGGHYSYYDPTKYKHQGFASPRPFIEHTNADIDDSISEIKQMIANRIEENLG